MPETIRGLFRMRFNRAYSSAEELASTGMSSTLGPTLSSIQVPSSKRSLSLMLGLSSYEIDLDRHFLTLYNELVDWQGPLPDYFSMHLADNLKLKHVKFIDNFDRILAQAISHYPALAFEIPADHEFSSEKRAKNLLRLGRNGGQQVETVADLVKAHNYRERLVASVASVLVGNAKTKDSELADFKNARTITWTNTPQTLLPGCEAARAAGYYSIDPALPGVADTLKTKRFVAARAINHFHLTDAAMIDIQPICPPLNANFPVSAMLQIAKQGLPLEPFACQGPEHPERYCGSLNCTCSGPDGSKQLTVTGRPTGVDGNPALELIRRAEPVNNHASLPLTPPELKTGSLGLFELWGKAVASDSTFLEISGYNKFVIALRDRKNQTLFLSEPQDIDRDPMLSYPAYVQTQLGFAVLAYDDACSRGVHMEDLRRRGTLPYRFRQRLDSEIDPLNSDLPFAQLASLYERDVGKFLPPILSNPVYTFDFNADLFQKAAHVCVNWDTDDANALRDILGDSQFTTLWLSVVDVKYEPYTTLDVKIHCWKQHGKRVFLCHLIDSNDPYGRPVVMKACRSRRVSDIPAPSAIEQQIEAERDTQNLEHEADMLYTLSRNDDLALRVPRMYGTFCSRIMPDGPDAKVFAYFMEDCEGYYPLGIADTISDTLQDELNLWLDTLHKNHIVHGNLSGENILFNPSEPDSFYVTGWGRSLTIADGLEIPDWDTHVANDLESLQTLFISKQPKPAPISEEPVEDVPMKKKSRCSDDECDGERMHEDDYFDEQAVRSGNADDEDGDPLRNYLSLSPPSGSVVAAYTAEEVAPTLTL